MALPPGVTAKTFAEATRLFKEAVGKPWVFTKQADVDLYRDAYSVLRGEPDERVASAAVAPANVEEVQKVVRIANEHRIPIYPISTGRNLGYGGSAPVLSGSVVLDLKRMNRVLDVNERNATCLVEPGVSYFDLYRHIQDRGLKLWVDVPDPGWGSPIGNSLDHGGGYTMTQFRNHFDAHCGMEVVLPDGELLRTGMGALPDAKTWQDYKFGIGPVIDGLFSQSNFGVVTKMGFWLMPQPDAYLTGSLTVANYEDLIPLIDILTYLENSGVCNGMPGLGSPLLNGANIAKDPELAAIRRKPGGGTQAELEAYARKKGTPFWSAELKFYGPEKAIRELWNFSKEKFSVIKGVQFQEGQLFKLPLTPEQLASKAVHRTEGGQAGLPEFGVPSLEMFSIGARSPANPEPRWGHAWFSPIIPRTGEAILEANRVFADAAREIGMPYDGFSMPSTYWARSFIFLFGFPVTNDPKENAKMRGYFRQIVKIGAEHGWGEYRTIPAMYDTVMSTYSFNNHALGRFHETLKDAIDPNGIISAGRYGIWPKHLRKGKAR